MGLHVSDSETEASCPEKINYPRTILSYLRNVKHCPWISLEQLT